MMNDESGELVPASGLRVSLTGVSHASRVILPDSSFIILHSSFMFAALR
jgi:hypothetical protein